MAVRWRSGRPKRSGLSIIYEDRCNPATALTSVSPLRDPICADCDTTPPRHENSCEKRLVTEHPLPTCTTNFLEPSMPLPTVRPLAPETITGRLRLVTWKARDVQQPSNNKQREGRGRSPLIGEKDISLTARGSSSEVLLGQQSCRRAALQTSAVIYLPENQIYVADRRQILVWRRSRDKGRTFRTTPNVNHLMKSDGQAVTRIHRRDKGVFSRADTGLFRLSWKLFALPLRRQYHAELRLSGEALRVIFEQTDR